MMAANRVSSMEYRPLGNTGMMHVSALSFGASSLGGVFRSTEDDESVACVHRAVAAGINYIDTAPWYGQGRSEQVLGKALRAIPRDAYYISTKVGRYAQEPLNEMFDFSADRTMRSVDESLQRLGLDYVDVIQVHDVEFAANVDQIVQETLPALQKVKEAGKARYIGVTGYPLDKLREVIERSTVHIDTLLTYCHYTMNDSSLIEHMQYFKDADVAVVNASPIAMGLLSERGPPAWHPATDDIKHACAQAAKHCKDSGVDISKLALHYTLQEKSIPTTLVSTASLKNLEKNLLAVTEPRTEKEQNVMEEVMTLFLRPLRNKGWEGVEVQQYWHNMHQLQQ